MHWGWLGIYEFAYLLRNKSVCTRPLIEHICEGRSFSFYSNRINVCAMPVTIVLIRRLFVAGSKNQIEINYFIFFIFIYYFFIVPMENRISSIGLNSINLYVSNLFEQNLIFALCFVLAVYYYREHGLVKLVVKLVYKKN